MLPVLFDFKGVKIYTFGVFLVLAFFWGSFLLWRNIRLTAYKEEEIFDGLFIGLAGGLFFGRLIFVILNFKDFGFNLLRFILINGYPGLSLLGVVFGGLGALFLFFLFKKIEFIKLIDYFAAPFFVALGFGKLGSFFSGVEAGTKTNFLIAVHYNGLAGLRHLTPFYEALLFFLAGFICQKILMAIRKETYPNGFAFYFFLWFFSLIYFLLDPLKANKLYFSGLSFNRVLSLVLLLTFSFYFGYYFRNQIFIRFKDIVGLCLSASKRGFEYGRKNFNQTVKVIREKFRARKKENRKTDKRP